MLSISYEKLIESNGTLKIPTPLTYTMGSDKIGIGKSWLLLIASPHDLWLHVI